MPEQQSIMTDEQPEQIVRLESADIADITMVMRLMNAAFSSLYGERWNVHQCRSMLALPGTSLTMAWLLDKPAGFMITRTAADEQELLMIAVDPQYQQKGVGCTLLRHLVTNASRIGVSNLFLEVRSSNPAQKLYRQFGFEKIGERKAYYTGANREKYDAVTYRRSL